MNAGERLEELTSVSNKASKTLQEMKLKCAESENAFLTIGVQLEWMSLCQALDFLPTNTQDPLSSFKLLMKALQCTGVVGIWLMLKYSELWSLAGMLVCVALVLSTTYAVRLAGQLRHFHGLLNSSQIAAMIQELRQRPGPENTPGAAS